MGIPAVVCVAKCTTKLKDGQRVCVNGTAGTVKILKDEHNKQ